MVIDEEVRALRMKLNIFREQNEKLQGSIRSLQATNESLIVTNEQLKEEKKKIQEAFDEIFIHNIGNAWDNFDDKKKKEMSLSDKVSFLNREVNFAKIYIRQQMDKRNRKITEEYERKIKELQSEIAKHKGDYENLTQGISLDDNKKSNIIKNPLDENIDNTGNPITKNGSSSLSIFKNKKKKEEIKTKTTDEIIADKMKEKGQEVKTKVESSPVLKEREERISLKAQPTDLYNQFIKMTEEEQEKKMNEIKDFLNSRKFTNRELAFFYALGRTGFYKMDEITREGKKECPEVSGASYLIRNKLIDDGLIIEGEDIATGKGRPMKPLFLSTLGQWVYFFTKKKNPMESLLVSIGKDQKSVGHGYRIQEVIKRLENAGYECKQEDVKITEAGKHSICDIEASRDGYVFRIEYEEGNYPKEGYFNKFRNILDVDDSIIFIGNNAEVRDKINGYFKEFVNREYGSEEQFKKSGKYSLFISLTEIQTNPNIILELKTKRR